MKYVSFFWIATKPVETFKKHILYIEGGIYRIFNHFRDSNGFQALGYN